MESGQCENEPSSLVLRSRRTTADEPASRRLTTPRSTRFVTTTAACWGLASARLATLRIVISVSVPCEHAEHAALYAGDEYFDRSLIVHVTILLY